MTTDRSKLSSSALSRELDTLPDTDPRKIVWRVREQTKPAEDNSRRLTYNLPDDEAAMLISTAIALRGKTADGDVGLARGLVCDWMAECDFRDLRIAPPAFERLVDRIVSALTEVRHAEKEPSASDMEQAKAIRIRVPNPAIARGYDIMQLSDVEAEAVATALAETRRAERDRAISLAHHYARCYPHGSDGRNTFEVYAETLSRPPETA